MSHKGHSTLTLWVLESAHHRYLNLSNITKTPTMNAFRQGNFHKKYNLILCILFFHIFSQCKSLPLSYNSLSFIQIKTTTFIRENESNKGLSGRPPMRDQHSGWMLKSCQARDWVQVSARTRKADDSSALCAPSGKLWWGNRASQICRSKLSK